MNYQSKSYIQKLKRLLINISTDTSTPEHSQEMASKGIEIVEKLVDEIESSMSENY